MVQQTLEYGRLVEQALRQVVRRALDHVAAHGLPGRHHFYVTFRTAHPGVVLDDGLRARYPTEMTIVLQHEFWDLQVGEDGFAVTLSFGGAPQRLEIPYEAITVFADPGVEFGLQFTLPTGRPPGPGGRSRAGPGEADGAGDGEDGAPEDGGAEVVALDRFRKK